jgi:subtilase family serine protease
MSLDTAGNTLGTARELPVRADSAAWNLRDRLDLTDTRDYYRFTLNGRSSINLVVNDLSADITLQLLDRNGNPLQTVNNAGGLAETLNRTLDTGTYYILVTPATTNTVTDYSLGFSTQSAGSVDLLWRNAGTGQTQLWQMQGTTRTATHILDWMPANWTLEATADFNGDGRPDLLWRDVTTGANQIWTMGGANNATRLATHTLATQALGWTLEGIADWSGDGRPDLLWRNGATGANQLWTMGGTGNLSRMGTVNLASAPTNWAIGGVYDFNGDGTPDIAWRDTTGSSNLIWLMGGANGATRTSEVPLESMPTAWRLEGIADVNRDGRGDLLWHNPTTGANTVWQLGSTFGSSTFTVASRTDLPSVTGSQRLVPLTRYGEPARLDLAGNTVATALNLGTLSRTGSYSDWVGTNDTADVFRFNLTATQTVTLGLTGLAADAQIQLLDSAGTVVRSSLNPGTAVESLTTTLNAGTYFIRVFQGAGDTAYTVNLTAATPQILRYNFTYFYNGSNTNSDYYTGTVVAYSGTYAVGTTIDAVNQLNQAGFNGRYWISGATLTGTVADLGKVWVSTYDDVDASRRRYVPTWQTNPGFAHGYNFLGSEEGTVQDQGRTARFGLDFHEVDFGATVAPPDLVSQFFDVVQEPLTAGSGFDVQFRVQNTGAGSAGAFRVGFYLSTDSTVTTGDRLLGFTDFATLAANTTSASQTQRLTLPGATDAFWRGNGTYFVGMVVDTLGAVAETSETNNANTGLGTSMDDVAVTVVAPPPPTIDLRGVSFDAAPEALAPNGTTTANFRVQNTGNTTAGAFRVGFYLSTDNTITTGDRLLGFTDINALAAGATTANLAQSLTLPGASDTFWRTSGPYFIGMIVDSANSIVETSEVNNANQGNGTDWDDVTVTLPPPPTVDLVGSLFDSTESLTAGGSTTISFAVQNTGTVGAGAFKVRFYLSTDSTITATDRLLGTADINALGANASTGTLTRSVTLPGATDAVWRGTGSYFLGMVVDADNTVVETNDTNNANRGNGLDWDEVTVTLPPAPTTDLAGLFFDAPASGAAGGSLNVSFAVQNTGNRAAGAFKVGLYLSTDSTITPGDRLLSTHDIASLAANGTSSSISRLITLPGATDPFWRGTSTYYIGLVIDTDNTVVETNETNNANRGNGIDWNDVTVTLPTTLVDPTAATGRTSGNLGIDALLDPSVPYWNTSTNGGIITYSFYKAAAGPYVGPYYREKATEVNETIKRSVRGILAHLETVINVRFQEMDEASGRSGVLRYMFSDGGNDPDFYAYAYYPHTHPVGGDIHLNAAYEQDPNNAFSGGYGTHGYTTLIHETFHALGLKHPGNYNGNGTGTGPFLSGDLDHTFNTVMSYNFDGPSAITPMAYDVRVLQYLYGARDFNATATSYRFSTVHSYSVNGQTVGTATQPMKLSLWDSNGVDTLDFSNLSSATSYHFDLREGGALTTQNAYNAFEYEDWVTGEYYTNTAFGTALTFGTVIENLVNSGANDTIIANGANNVFQGYTTNRTTGSDVIEGGNAADVLDLSSYSLAGLTATVAGSHLTIRLGTNGTVQLRNYYGTNGQMRILVGGTYYTYTAGRWQVATAPLRPVQPGTPLSRGLTALTHPTVNSAVLQGHPTACRCLHCGRPNGWNQLGQSNLTRPVKPV